MYPRTVTEKIVEYWALGFSAEETREVLIEKQGVTIALNTIYAHRHSLTAQHLVDQLIHRQERAILKADTDNPALAMKYRNELLKILLPQRVEADVRQQTTSIQLVKMWLPDNEPADDSNPELRAARKAGIVP